MLILLCVVSLLTGIGMAPVQAESPDTTLYIGGVAFPFIWVEPGSFERADAEGVHEVVITEGFWMGQTEVTARQWVVLMETADLPDEEPVRGISWQAIHAFTRRMSAVAVGLDLRLPTEAEWMFVAQAEEPSRSALEAVAWIRSNAGGRVQPVATRASTARGFHDLFGNVWEWTKDWHAPDAYARASRTDPQGPAKGTEKVRRGGSAVYGPAQATATYRYQQPPGRGNGNLGFRLVAVPAW